MEIPKKDLDDFFRKHGKAIEKDIHLMYKHTMTNIRGHIGDLFSLYATSEGLLHYADLVKYDRLSKFEKKLYNELDILYKFKKERLPKHFSETLQEIYIQNTASISEATKHSLLPKPIEEEETIIQKPIGGIPLDERLRQHQETLGNQMKATFIGATMIGIGYMALSKKMTKTMERDLNKTMFIKEQEDWRMKSESLSLSAQFARARGVRIKKRWIATMDDRVRVSHAELDGVEIDIGEEFFIGGYGASEPRMFGNEEDINCRCETMLIYE